MPPAFGQSFHLAPAHSPDSSGSGVLTSLQQPTNSRSGNLQPPVTAYPHPKAAANGQRLSVSCRLLSSQRKQGCQRWELACPLRLAQRVDEQPPRLLSTVHALNGAYCTEYLPYILKQPRSHPCQHALSVPAPCGSLPGPYLSSCTATTRVTSLAQLHLFPVSTRRTFLPSSLRFAAIYLLPASVCSGQQGKERIST